MINQLFIIFQVGWTPSRESIRPTPDQIEKKKNFLANMQNIYHSLDDYALSKFLGCETEPENRADGPSSPLVVRKIDKIQGHRRHSFRPNMFRYQVPQGTNHYVLWCALDPSETVVSDVEIDDILTRELTSLCGESQYQYIWYENPKPSMLEDAASGKRHVYHVQVFWIRS